MEWFICANQINRDYFCVVGWLIVPLPQEDIDVVTIFTINPGQPWTPGVTIGDTYVVTDAAGDVVLGQWIWNGASWVYVDHTQSTTWPMNIQTWPWAPSWTTATNPYIYRDTTSSTLYWWDWTSWINICCSIWSTTTTSLQGNETWSTSQSGALSIRVDWETFYWGYSRVLTTWNIVTIPQLKSITTFGGEIVGPAWSTSGTIQWNDFPAIWWLSPNYVGAGAINVNFAKRTLYQQIVTMPFFAFSESTPDIQSWLCFNPIMLEFNITLLLNGASTSLANQFIKYHNSIQTIIPDPANPSNWETFYSEGEKQIIVHDFDVTSASWPATIWWQWRLFHQNSLPWTSQSAFTRRTINQILFY